MTVKKRFPWLCIIGILLLVCGIFLAVLATGNRNIIGGADFPTFRFVFFYDRGGLYAYLAGSGLICLILSFILRRKKL